MCRKRICMLAAAVLILAFMLLPAETFEQTENFVYHVISCEPDNNQGGGVIRAAGQCVGLPSQGWFRQEVKINETQRRVKDRIRLSVFLHLFFAFSALTAAHLPWERAMLMARQEKDGKKWRPAAACGIDEK